MRLAERFELCPESAAAAVGHHSSRLTNYLFKNVIIIPDAYKSVIQITV